MSGVGCRGKVQEEMVHGEVESLAMRAASSDGAMHRATISKTRAAANVGRTRPGGVCIAGSPQVPRGGCGFDCSILVHRTAHGLAIQVRTVALVFACLLAGSVRACPDPPWPVEALAPNVWLVRSASGEATQDNRGRVSNLLIVRDPRRVWLLGSGPSPASARALACQLRRDLGLVVTDVVAPWARPELVLGHAAWPAARHWAHADVRRSMAASCASCVQVLRARLGAAAEDLDAGDPVVLPGRILAGEQGRLGPLRWWRLRRSAERSVTLWRVRRSALWVAHGLLWGDGPPDARDADVALLASSTERALQLARRDGVRATWVPEQGSPLSAPAAAAQAAYWRRLQEAARETVSRGEVEGVPPPPGLAGRADWEAHPRHAMSWQRVMRQTSDAMFNRPR